MPRLLTQAQFSRRTKYSKARVCQLCRDGTIELRNGLIDPIQGEAAIRARVGHLHHPRERRSQLKLFAGNETVEVCRQCDVAEKNERWYCSKLNLTISKRRESETVVSDE